MDGTWRCGECGAFNLAGTATCYSCGTARLIPPIPGTRIYEPVPADEPLAPASPISPEDEGHDPGDDGRGGPGPTEGSRPR